MLLKRLIGVRKSSLDPAFDLRTKRKSTHGGAWSEVRFLFCNGPKDISTMVAFVKDKFPLLKPVAIQDKLDV